ncbi:MAG: MBL fold metallo-hydrolase [Candidatus Bathyarchaeota archaeon]
MVIKIAATVKIKFLGGTMEVGRSAIAIQSSDTQILVDYGVLVGREPGFPIHVPPNEVDAIVLTHSHLDHSGAIPIFHIIGKTPVFGTPLCCELAKLLIIDFLHLSGYYLPYEYMDLQTMMSSCIYTEYRQAQKIGDMTIELLNSGHIPGSSQAIIESSGKRILYTSDFNTYDTRLVKGADQNYGKIDALIMESTYASDDHQDRLIVEDEFMKRVNEVVERGGTVLVPAFSVGRSQEILCVLAANHFKYPVAFDGMAKDVTEILLRYPTYLRDSKLFVETINSTNWIKGWSDRRRFVKKPGVIVSPAGMLKGGNAIFYMNTIAKKEENAVFLVSYQIPDSPGRYLLDTNKFIIGGKMREVKASVAQFDFSSHCGRSQLLETAKLMSGDTQIFIMHGAEGNCQRLATEIKQDVGLTASVPKAGDIIQI